MTRLVQREPDDQGRSRWCLELTSLEAGILKTLPEQLGRLLSDPDANRRIVDRLFPAAHEDEEDEREHRRLLGSTLLDERKELLREIEASLTGARAEGQDLAVELDPLSLDVWLRFLNDARLVLATDLGIEENLPEEAGLDPDDPDGPRLALLEYLGGLQALLLEAASREFG